MVGRALVRTFVLVLLSAWCVFCAAADVSNSSWSGVLNNAAGKPMAGAVVALHSSSPAREYRATTAANGRFRFAELPAGDYEIYDWRITQSSGNLSTVVSPSVPFSIPFHVSPREAVYIGSCTFQLSTATARRGAVVECAEWPDRDLPLLQQRYPSLGMIAKTAGVKLLYRSSEYSVHNQVIDPGG